ncbi:histone arginine methyltransferase PRMT1 [Toxoplasma gondii ME49]|uniref:Histone arginine methyltransferase PRMT1 n=8 Tax=Toxoplasma gondii TaxID=5811 RepID=Q2VTP7_TOXGO|nr:histone arginine methyltransferase PRMT1 [Toxoplasma gondii ME49]AAX19953.1 protein arginine methyltransferase [Toxoplasma gondii]EPR63935.1 histone arginine methyltransferase PRMT1 [Toxoplasma gondii GT1]KFG64905.1 histone arginine methyltransferase PRMT1 [Toxoplasma gondii RUB]KFH15720.1 histone arginine methyltransferase PRMT1 [Toxoplasma gondii MAS]KYF48608.1 histone arginine methyltransferase PRMT1 [Toxoplasma gondii ARI]PIL96845.1 histone arginine methyltransferase PRMT1 [Toxoplasma |eukprot:XP_002370706.1 histone arginine methyltransferase PRMT1 [Toxoplasma gondii ME49]
MSSSSPNSSRSEAVNGRVVVPTGGSRRENSGPARGPAGFSATVLPCDEATKAAFAKDWKDLEQENLSSADYYFNSYAHFGIHEEMIKDSVRTGCYQRAICQNAHLFANKVVLDVGSGTGILSLFAAKAGAKHVYGIECSEIVNIARKIVKENDMEDKVTFVQGKAEEVSLPVEKVDIIISEWMGYFLLYESMLDTVLFCRDKWLKPGGMIFPDKAALYVAAIEDADYKEEKIGYWGNVYGFNFSCVRRCVMEEPIVDTVDENAVSTTSCCVLKLDLLTCTKEDLDFCAPYEITLRRKDFLHAFIAWFDVWFSHCHKPVVLSTGPHCRYTHWKQTVFYMEDVLVADVGDKVEGMIAVKKSQKNPRDLDIKISYTFNPPHAPAAIENTQFYRLR